ncbi:MAG: 4-(cytidine 5'-diphospho)-2-C-methyl-D-erythritol kinase [Clostridia bacterium]|nr:4-(cytidine 5'-diphospho)-2-C-methyl-D-erythritol kinase [Clostridia bacterium]
MRITVSSPAKINLFLDITGKRSDGYHLISTVMQSVSLYDDVTVSLDEDGSGITVSCTDHEIPCGSTNTAYIAAEKFFEYTKLPPQEVTIKIKKRIPSGAGMAGGSTDAAAVIFALNSLLKAGLSVQEMAEIGEEVGADVPFCIYGGTMSASGIGTILSPLPDMPDCHILVVKPEIKISTKEAYDKSDSIGYDNVRSADRLINSVCNGSVKGIADELYNKFEEVMNVDETEKIKDKMKSFGALGAVMTGSGSAVYGIFDNKDDAEDCENVLKDSYDNLYLLHPVAKGPEQTTSGILNLF